MNQYGASSRAEFFAVATECFFERPLALEKQHPELYAILRDFYLQDPARWHWPAVGSLDEQLDLVREEESPTSPSTLGQPGKKSAHRGADAFFADGAWLLNERRYQEAVAAFDKAIALSPDDAEILAHRALGLSKLGDIARSLEDANAAIQIDDADAVAWRVRAMAHLALAQYDDALADCARALAIDRRNGESYRLRGICRTALGELRRALRDFGAAIHFDADLAETLRARADAYERLGRFEKARADREKALRLDLTSTEN